MNDKETVLKAAELYILSKRETRDIPMAVLEILAILGKDSAADILKVYKKITEGDYKVCELFLFNQADASLTETVKNKITQQLGDNIIFLIKEDKKLLGGWQAKIGDKVIDNSLLLKVREIEI